MQLLAHKKIKTFTQDMLVAEPEDIEPQRDNLMRHMYDDMREGGYLPCLDLISYTSERDPATGKFKITLSLYGVFVGKEEAWRSEGVEISNSGRVYPLATPGRKVNY